MKNIKLIVFLSAILMLIGCSPSEEERKLLLRQVESSILNFVENPINPNFTVLKLKYASLSERGLMSLFSNSWIACAEIKSKKSADQKPVNRRFFFVNDIYSPLIVEVGKYPNLDEGNEKLWRDLCSF